MMGRTVGQTHHAEQKPSIPAADDGVGGGRGIRPQPDLPFEQRHPELVDYQPDLGGAIQGSDMDSAREER